MNNKRIRLSDFDSLTRPINPILAQAVIQLHPAKGTENFLPSNSFLSRIAVYQSRFHEALLVQEPPSVLLSIPYLVLRSTQVHRIGREKFMQAFKQPWFYSRTLHRYWHTWLLVPIPFSGSCWWATPSSECVGWTGTRRSSTPCCPCTTVGRVD